jgi:hypothetical protein
MCGGMGSPRMAERIELAVGNLVDASPRGRSDKAAVQCGSASKRSKHCSMQHAHAALNRRPLNQGQRLEATRLLGFSPCNQPSGLPIELSAVPDSIAGMRWSWRAARLTASNQDRRKNSTNEATEVVLGSTSKATCDGTCTALNFAHLAVHESAATVPSPGPRPVP